jgi:phosphoketolase
MKAMTLSPELLLKMDAYWRAANYLSVGQIYLYDNPLLKLPLKLLDVKPIVVGHWGTTPGQNFIYVHLNRVIKKYDLDMFYVAGHRDGGPAIVGNVYLEGTYSEIYPNISQHEAGMKKLFKQFSFPGGISSHVAPTTPGSIHEGGELGYSLKGAYLKQQMQDKLIEHKHYIDQHSEDLPEIRDLKWGESKIRKELKSNGSPTAPMIKRNEHRARQHAGIAITVAHQHENADLKSPT